MYIRTVVWISIFAYFTELFLKTQTSHETPIFLWIERTCASILTVEYFARIYVAKKKLKYLTSPLGIIDLLSVLPFWAAFFIPVNYHGLIRTLRLIRFGKFFRYNKSLQFIGRSFQDAWPQLKIMIGALIVVGLFNTALIHELEKKAQPDSFGEIGNCAWYVLVSATTVGYGDMSPITPLGKICASIFLLFPALMIYAGIVGIVGSSFVKVISSENT